MNSVESAMSDIIDAYKRVEALELAIGHGREAAIRRCKDALKETDPSRLSVDEKMFLIAADPFLGERATHLATIRIGDDGKAVFACREVR